MDGFRVFEEIGNGSQGHVYRAEKNGREYACKVSDDRETLLREGELLKELNRENIHNIPRFAEYHERDRAYLYIEYIKGASLETYIKMMRKCLWREKNVKEEYYKIAHDILLSIAQILKTLHNLSQPVIYMDLKPENIIITKNNAVYLIDFGSGAYLYEGFDFRTGTVGYGAPEQFVKGSRIGLCSDVYAFGRLAHYMLTGDNPYLAPYEKLPIDEYDGRLGKRLSGLISACTRAEPSLRPPDMGYVYDRLRNIPVTEGGILKLFKKRGYEGEYEYIKNVALR